MERKKPSKMPAWEVILNVRRDTDKWDDTRPRFFTPHAIAAILGRRDLKKIVAMLKKSGRVATCYCPVVKAPVMYPMSYANDYGSWEGTWKTFDAFIERYPYPEVKGFKAPAVSDWDHKAGIYRTISSNAMNEPFIERDRPYANKIIKALKAAGYKPKMKPYKL